MCGSKSVLAALVAMFVIFVTTSDVASQSQTSALVKHRQSIMKQMGQTYRVFGPVLKGRNKNVRDAMAAAATRLVEESDKLIDAASTNEIQTFRTQFKALVTACGGCHSGKAAKGGKFRFAKN